MAEILIQSGIRYDDIYIMDESENRVKIGVAVYDLEDMQVISNLAHLEEELKIIGDEYNPRVEELQNSKNIIAIADLCVEYVDKMIEKIDDVFGAGFCQKAIGDRKNPFMLWEIIGEIIFNYEGVRDDRLSKYTNRAQRRVKAKAGNRK